LKYFPKKERYVSRGRRGPKRNRLGNERGGKKVRKMRKIVEKVKEVGVSVLVKRGSG